MKAQKFMPLTGALAAGLLALTACGATEAGSEGDGGGDDPAAGGETDWSDCTPGAESAEADVASDENKDITIGAFNGWD